MSDKGRAVAAALLGRMPLPVRPFDPDSDVPVDLGLGGLSTEVLGTYDTPTGEFANVPSAWFVGDHGPFLVDDPIPLAHDYELGTGKAFPRYNTLDEAVMGAQYRSGAGGAEDRSITGDMPTLFARKSLYGFGF